MSAPRYIFRHPALMLPVLICLVGSMVAGTAIATLFVMAIDQEKVRLTQMVRSQASLMEAVAEFDTQYSTNDHPDGAFAATMKQIAAAHQSLNGFGETGEFVIGKLIDGQAALLQKSQHEGEVNFEIPAFVPIPMQRALAGESGEITATDYKGNEVLAAFVPVPVLNIGLVAKIDTDELYRPFVVSGGIVAAITLTLLVLGVYASRLFSSPFTQLERQKQRAEKYLNIAGTIILSLSRNATIRMINDKGAEVLGRDKNDLHGQNWFDIAIPESQTEIVRQAFRQIMDGNLEPVAEFENTVLTSTGEERLIVWHNSYLRDETGTISGCLCAGEDITDRRKMENDLRISEERFTKSQNFANIGTWDWNIQTGALYWSDRIAPLFGYEVGALETTYDNFEAAIHPDDRQLVTDAVSACVESGVEYNIEHRVVWPDGTVRILLEKGDVVRDADGKPLNMLGVVQDITESKNMQAQLIQSSKMATLGEMATGVAHELNQPLNVIRMAVNNIQRKSQNNNADPAYLSDKLSKIDSQVDRATAIIDHMRIFGRKADTTPAVLDSKQMVDAALGLIGGQLRLADVAVTIESPEACPLIRGHQVQVEQVLLNLIGNARDALNDKTDGDRRIAITIGEDIGNVYIALEDNGGGIAPDDLPRIFEPFFTTKEVGQGTGLGLSISYGIINDMGGSLSVANTEDGARFLITLPTVEKNQATA